MSRTDIPCFLGGSELVFGGDVAAFGVLANCLSGRVDEFLQNTTKQAVVLATKD